MTQTWVKSWKRSSVVIAALGACWLGLPQCSWAFEDEVKAQARNIARDISKTDIKKVAVVDFGDLQDNVTALGRFLAEEFSGALARAGKSFVVIDRMHLQRLLREHELSSIGLIDTESVIKLGKISGVDALVIGRLTPLADDVRLSLQVLDAETATVIAARADNISETDGIKALLKQEIEDIEIIEMDENGSGLTRESNGIRFSLQRCRKFYRNEVRCTFMVKSPDRDQRLTISGGSKAVDEGGRDYLASRIEIGSRKGDEVSNDLVSGTPIRAEVTFEDVPARTRKLVSLDLDCKDFRVKFQNVPVAQ